MDNIFGGMPKCMVTLSANAGVSMQISGKKLWIDALNDTKVNEFSTITPELLKKMKNRNAFRDPDALIFTHCHPDHFSQELTESVIRSKSEVGLFLPEEKFATQTLITDDHIEDIGDVRIHFLKTVHDGEEFRDVPHFALVISSEIEDGKRMNVLVVGDTQIAGEDLRSKLSEYGYLDEGIDLAMIDFPWVTLKKGRDAIEEWIQPDHLFIYHLPFEEEDSSGFHAATEASAAKLTGIGDVRIIKEPLQTESI